MFSFYVICMNQQDNLSLLSSLFSDIHTVIVLEARKPVNASIPSINNTSSFRFICFLSSLEEALNLQKKKKKKNAIDIISSHLFLLALINVLMLNKLVGLHILLVELLPT